MERIFKKKLKKEKSENCPGYIMNEFQIPILKKANYCIIPVYLDGDAPKSFIKAYFYEKGGKVFKRKHRTWKSFIAKSAEKWYPHESIIEFLLNRIGQELGLNMNSVKLLRINGQIRFLSQYFLKDNEQLMHGAEICGEYLNDEDFAKQIALNKKTARELFTIEFIFEAIKSVFKENYESISSELIKMMVFDAIVGNNDRHFYNWGVIKPVKINNRTNPVFCPLYDSARGLFWNWSDKRIQASYDNSKSTKVNKYMINASPRISIENDSEINHFNLIKHLWETYPQYQGTISALLTLEKEKKVISLYNNEFKQFFIKERNELVCRLIQARFKKLRNIIKA